uniref:Spindle pole body component 110-like n=1 Tax=Saccoglossus kowalevskii TaxID=10224 RepID=A0ABM0MZH4_SACKO|nr:PREDICTED: spindle pole body component 110-like [Saccoglossus kowalevskii]
MREQVTKKSHDVLKVKRELGEVSLEKEELQTRLSQSQERLTSKERLQQHRSFDDMDLQDGLPNSRRSSIELEFDLHKELQNRPASHSRIYNHYHQQPPSGLSRFEVEQMLLDLSRQIQKQLDQQKDVLKNQSGADENKKLAQLENDLSMEKAFRAVEKLQIQALHDEMNGLRQHLQNIRKSRDTLASERNQQRVLTRMDEINNLIAQSHTRAQTMAFTSMGVSVLDNPIMRMNSREFIQHLQSESPFKTQFTE